MLSKLRLCCIACLVADIGFGLLPVDPPWPLQLGSQNPPKIVPEGFQKVIIFLIVCWVRFWWHLVPTWLQLGRQNPPKIDPSWSQNPLKKRSRCWPNFGFIFHRSGDPLVSIFLRSWKAETAKRIGKHNSFLTFLLFQPTCQVETQVDSKIDHMASCWQVVWNSKIATKLLFFAIILGPSAPNLDAKLTKERPQTDEKWSKKLVSILIPFLMDFGTNLNRFWEGFGGQVGAKCHQNSTPKPIKKMITFWEPSGTIFDGFSLPRAVS